LIKSERVDEEDEENEEKVGSYPVSKKEEIKTINNPKVVSIDRDIPHSNKRKSKKSAECRCEIF